MTQEVPSSYSNRYLRQMHVLIQIFEPIGMLCSLTRSNLIFSR